MNQRKFANDIIAKLLKKGFTLEQISTKVEAPFSTVYSWKIGSRRPSNLVFKALEKMAR